MANELKTIKKLAIMTKVYSDVKQERTDKRKNVNKLTQTTAQCGRITKVTPQTRQR